MDRNTLFEILEDLKESLGTDTLLTELAQAQSSKELQENLEFIDRMHDLNIVEKYKNY